MVDRVSTNVSALERFLQEGWRIESQKDINHGRQVIVTDGIVRLPVNFYSTGRIVVQGKHCEMKTALTEWANLTQAGLSSRVATDTPAPQNRVAKYLVIPDNIEKIRQVILSLPGEVIKRDVGGPAEVYRVEVRDEGHRVTITQYSSGTLMVQGLSTAHFDAVCEALDEHLSQSFVDRATRFITGDDERTAVTAYLGKPDAENEATRWLLDRVGKDVLDFLYDEDYQTLLAAAGVRGFASTNRQLPDYSVVVMPFAKVFEGFVMRLAVHLELTTEDALRQRANKIEIAEWIQMIKRRLPDAKRYGEIQAALESAWQCRNKALHSDFVFPLSTLRTFVAADQEVSTILRAMTRAHTVFVEQELRLEPVQPTGGYARATSEPEDCYRYARVDREHLRKQLEADGLDVSVQPEGRRNVWELNSPELMVIAPREQEGLVIIKGSKSVEFCEKYKTILDGESVGLEQTGSLAWIGVDESGKGDLFGPLVIAGVAITLESKVVLARRGVRDSKALSDDQVLHLAQFVRMSCPVEVLVLPPPDYNTVYECHGRNLNRLLAWGHARVISSLSQRLSAYKAVSDQFGDESLLVEALAAEACQIPVEQRPHAESDLAVAAASVIARAEFMMAIKHYSEETGIEIPLGASARQVKEVGKRIYRRWGRQGLQRIAKMHFKTIQDIMFEVDR